MNSFLRLFLPVLLLSACSTRPDRPAMDWFDLGASPAEAQTVDDTRRAWRVTVRSIPDLEDEAMRYRLEYAGPAGAAQVLTYARSRWISPPAEILRRRLAQYLFWPDGVEDRCHIILSLTRFEQVFSAPGESAAVIALEAEVWNSGTGRLEDEARFSRTVKTRSPDAAGGVVALSEAATRLATENLIPWREKAKQGRQRMCWRGG
ncbi:MAG: PqiC family protein [Zoogloeaceae bacterium]|jgi:cholesterol transport system auxiliary component|nr:PqiC family protein [Zoogloeaceae bacterium]